MEEIYKLWNNEYPADLCYTNPLAFENYLKGLGNQHHFLLVDGEDTVKGWFVDFMREGEKWFTMILGSGTQGKGYGSELLNRAKLLSPEINGWVIDHNNDKKRNGEIYSSPIAFYKKQGFEIVADTRLELDIISAAKIRWRK
ncbi:GNAT superfamily N-acetyltransferase [Pontibacter aydingkolensis]|nr:GNAT family N-acetyltransferase [Pontibacter aydingkolensis]